MSSAAGGQCAGRCIRELSRYAVISDAAELCAEHDAGVLVGYADFAFRHRGM